MPFGMIEIGEPSGVSQSALNDTAYQSVGTALLLVFNQFSRIMFRYVERRFPVCP